MARRQPRPRHNARINLSTDPLNFINRELYRTRRGVPGARNLALTRIPSIICLLALAACGNVSAMLNPVSPADVSTLEEGVTIAETLALNYTRLPACPTAAPICSVSATKQAVKRYGQAAHDAARTLRTSSAANAPAALAAAQVALAALRASIPPVAAVSSTN
jgi:hypothetical protein